MNELYSLEREHVIGFSGSFTNTLKYHPAENGTVLLGMGSNLVVQKLSDAHDQEFLVGHDEAISAFEISNSGMLAASGQVGSSSVATLDAKVIVWDVARRIEVYELTGMTLGVKAIAFSPDELFLAASGEDCVFIVWDMKSGEVIASKREAEVVTTLVWTKEENPGSSRPQYCIYATIGAQVVCYRLKYSVANMDYVMTTEFFRMPSGLIREHRSSCISSDGSKLVVSTNVGDIIVYRLENMIYDAQINSCSSGANCVAPCRSNCGVNGCIYVGGGDGSLKQLLDVGGKWILQSEISLPGSIISLSISRCESRLIAGTSNGYIYEFEILTDGQLSVIQTIQTETSEVVAAAFKRKCSVRFATLSKQGNVKVWDLADYSVVAQNQEKIIQSTNGNYSYGSCIFYDDVDDQVLTGWTGGQIRAYCATRGPSAGNRVWDIDSAHRDGVGCLVATDLYYASGGMGPGSGVRLWSRTSRSQLFQFSDHMHKTVTAIVPDIKLNHLLHSCGLDGSVFTYDLKREKRVGSHQLSRRGAFVSMTQRLDSENELVTAGLDGCLLTWDGDVADPVSELSVFPSSIRNQALTEVSVSPLSGRYIAASTSSGLICIWNISTGCEVSRIKAHGASVNSIRWSPDEKQIVTVGDDNCITVWNFFGEILAQHESKK